MLDLKTDIKITIPQIPSGWEKISGNIDFEIVYFSDGRIKTLRGFSFGDELKLKIEKDIVPVAAWPVLEGILFKPAGAVYPYNLTGEFLKLNWEGGFCAEILLNLSEKGVDFSNFNIKRFNKYLIDISEGNPWKVSESEILYALSNNIFNSNYAGIREIFSIELADPFFIGSWKLANPLDKDVYIDSGGGRIILDNIFTGRHVLLNIDSGEEKYGELFIENDSWKIIFNNNDGGLSGEL